MRYPEQNNTNFPQKITDLLKDYEVSSDTKFSCERTGEIRILAHQKLLEKFLSEESPYRGIYVYHGLGSGKTLTSILIASQHLQKKNVVALMPSRLKTSYIEELKIFGPKQYRYPENFNEMTKQEKQQTEKRIEKNINEKFNFISYNAGNSSQQLYFVGGSDESIENVIKKGTLDDKVIIIDEVHGFLANLISAGAKNAEKIFEMIMKAKNSKIVILSGTPAYADPYEIAMGLNMVRGLLNYTKGPIKNENLLFPDRYKDFVDIFIDKENNTIKNPEIFKSRCVGLISYYKGVYDPEGYLMPRKHDISIKEVKMSNYQFNVYKNSRKNELEEERVEKHRNKGFEVYKMKKPFRKSNTTYKTATRQFSNFVPPEDLKMPSKDELNKMKKGEKSKAKVKIFKEQLDRKKLKGKSLYDFSCKFYEILKELESTKDELSFVFTNFNVFGAQIFAIILQANGFTEYSDSLDGTNGMRYAILSGDTPDKEKKHILDVVNDPENKNGKYVRVIIGTTIVAQGITFKNMKNVHILEPQWRWAVIEQAIGRAVRFCSHNDLKPEKRFVKTNLYIAVEPETSSLSEELGESMTTDQDLYQKSQKEYILLERFFDAMKEAAFDCRLLYEHNKEEFEKRGLKCFTCVPTNEKMYYDNINLHLQHGNNCKMDMEEEELQPFKYDGKEYMIDNDDGIYELIGSVYIQIGFWDPIKEKIIAI